MSELPVPSRQPAPPETPEDLYDTLQGSDASVRHLWAHQADALRTYYEKHREAADVALEFPTGAGKTLVGLLIAEWRRKALKERVAFVCPNNQLARQAAAKARGYGVDVELLIGSHRDWEESSRATFERGSAVAVTNYHHIFNSDPKIDAQALVLDDAHAGEAAVAGRWTIDAKRGTPIYDALRDVIQDTLPQHVAGLLREESADPFVRHVVELVTPTVIAHRQDRIARLFDDLLEPDSSSSYAWKSVRPGLACCLMYVSWSRISVRPLIAPTSTLPEFVDAKQRVYMSATLGQAGELERCFGVTKIDRIPLPRGWERQGSGRRLPLFPTLSRTDDALDVVRLSMKKAKHSLVIVPSERDVASAIESFVPDELSIIKRDDVAFDFTAFTKQESAVLVLANRYDGMDLPDEACRLVLLYGLPIGIHLQEKFLFETLGAREALEERIRTRITQGMGRGTRNRQDFAAVVLLGQDLVSFLSREDVRRSMRPELQAELELGFYHADKEVSISEALDVFYRQDGEWQQSESYLRDTAEERKCIPMPGTEQLTASVASEIRAWRHAWREDFAGARDHAVEAAAPLGGEAVKHYRALWLYLAASWGRLVAERSDKATDLRLAAELSRDAEMAFNSLKWFPRFEDRADAPVFGPEYSWRSDRAADWVDKYRRGPRLRNELNHLKENIRSDEYKKFEEGLEALGTCLGFEAFRSQEMADPDGAWREGDEAWLVWEAKTMENPDKPLSARAVRQANGHRNWVSSQLSWPDPKESITVIVSSRSDIDPAAIAVSNENLFLVAPEILGGIAERADAALTTAGAEAPGLTLDQLRNRLGELFAQYRLGTDEILAELKKQPISGRTGTQH